MKKYQKILIIFITILFIATCAFMLYVNDYYHKSDDVTTMQEQYSDMITHGQSYDTFNPSPDNDKHTAILFYPGGKVEPEAYTPLMIKLTQAGYTCILFKMPFNLAVFDANAATKVVDQLDNVDKYIMMGHSLGGAMASQFTINNENIIDGLVLLGAYPVGPTNVPTLTLYGENDLVVNREKLEQVEDRIQIKGGNHGHFVIMVHKLKMVSLQLPIASNKQLASNI